MISVDIPAEASRAGVYAVIGGALLKLAELLLRRSGHQHKEALAEIDASLHIGATIREELEKRCAYLEKKLKKAEWDLDEVTEERDHLQNQLAASEASRLDSEAEVRLLRRAQRTPIPPSKPVVPEEKR